MFKYLVTLYYADEHGIQHFMSKGTYTAESEADAEECILQNCWDPRLEAASCSPVVTAKLIEEEDEY